MGNSNNKKRQEGSVGAYTHQVKKDGRLATKKEMEKRQREEERRLEELKKLAELRERIENTGFNKDFFQRGREGVRQTEEADTEKENTEERFNNIIYPAGKNKIDEPTTGTNHKPLEDNKQVGDVKQDHGAINRKPALIKNSAAKKKKRKKNRKKEEGSLDNLEEIDGIGTANFNGDGTRSNLDLKLVKEDETSKQVKAPEFETSNPGNSDFLNVFADHEKSKQFAIPALPKRRTDFVAKPRDKNATQQQQRKLDTKKTFTTEQEEFFKRFMHNDRKNEHIVLNPGKEFNIEICKLSRYRERAESRRGIFL